MVKLKPRQRLTPLQRRPCHRRPPLVPPCRLSATMTSARPPRHRPPPLLQRRPRLPLALLCPPCRRLRAKAGPPWRAVGAGPLVVPHRRQPPRPEPLPSDAADRPHVVVVVVFRTTQLTHACSHSGHSQL